MTLEQLEKELLKKEDYRAYINLQKKASRKILKDLEGYIKKNYGTRCKKPVAGCMECQAWAVVDLLKTFLH